MKKYFKHSFILFSLLLLMLALPLTAQAKPTKKRVTQIYTSFLKLNGYDWFLSLDINRDGIKELIVSFDQKNSWDDHTFYIYSVKKNKIAKIGSVEESASLEENKGKKHIYYSKKYKAIRDTSTGAYSLMQTLYQYQPKKTALKSRYYCNAVYGRFPFRLIGTNEVDAYGVSDAKYNAYEKKYMNSCAKKYLYKNTARNRKKYL